MNPDGSYTIRDEDDSVYTLEPEQIEQVVAAATHRSIEDTRIILQVEAIYRKHRPQGWEPEGNCTVIAPAFFHGIRKNIAWNGFTFAERPCPFCFPDSIEGANMAEAFLRELGPELWQSYCLALPRFTNE